LAARHLLACGCRRIAWVGPMGTGHQALERFGGATSVLAAEGIEVAPERRCRLKNAQDPEGTKLARELLGGPHRPDGVLALWQGCTRSVVRAARDLGLVPERDFRLVGWATEGAYETEHVPQFGGGPVSPAVAWSVDVLADVAVSRLGERRSQPGLEAITLKVPVRLRQHVA
jgi:DNA-binding LacI/PurR family transcriptional regulator